MNAKMIFTRRKDVIALRNWSSRSSSSSSSRGSSTSRNRVSPFYVLPRHLRKEYFGPPKWISITDIRWQQQGTKNQDQHVRLYHSTSRSSFFKFSKDSETLTPPSFNWESGIELLEPYRDISASAASLIYAASRFGEAQQLLQSLIAQQDGEAVETFPETSALVVECLGDVYKTIDGPIFVDFDRDELAMAMICTRNTICEICRLELNDTMLTLSGANFLEYVTQSREAQYHDNTFFESCCVVMCSLEAITQSSFGDSRACSIAALDLLPDSVYLRKLRVSMILNLLTELYDQPLVAKQLVLEAIYDCARVMDLVESSDPIYADTLYDHACLLEHLRNVLGEYDTIDIETIITTLEEYIKIVEPYERRRPSAHYKAGYHLYSGDTRLPDIVCPPSEEEVIAARKHFNSGLQAETYRLPIFGPHPSTQKRLLSWLLVGEWSVQDEAQTNQERTNGVIGAKQRTNVTKDEESDIPHDEQSSEKRK